MTTKNHNPIEDLFRDIFELCNRGMRTWLEQQPDRWAILLGLGKKVNHILFENVEETRTTLLAYRSFLEEMTFIYESGEQLKLFTEATPELTQTRTQTGERQEHEMKVAVMFPSKYLSKDDLEKPEIFTIDTVELDEVRTEEGKTEEKPILHFTDDESKPLILNRTNAEYLAECFGLDSDTWGGKVIELYVDPSVSFGKKRIGGIRVRIPNTPAAEAPF